MALAGAAETVASLGRVPSYVRSFIERHSRGQFVSVESFYCSPPKLCFNEIAGCETSPWPYRLNHGAS